MELDWEKELVDDEIVEEEDGTHEVVVTAVGDKVWAVLPRNSQHNIGMSYIESSVILSFTKEEAVKLVYALSEYLKD